MPFGISSAPEHYQKHMNKILDGFPGVVCLIDDILVQGTSKAEHDRNLEAVLKHTQSTGITLNKDKCEFGKETINFLAMLSMQKEFHQTPRKP